jgi:cellulose biosynthesis protein BcsQ
MVPKYQETNTNDSTIVFFVLETNFTRNTQKRYVIIEHQKRIFFENFERTFINLGSFKCCTS